MVTLNVLAPRPHHRKWWREWKWSKVAGKEGLVTANYPDTVEPPLGAGFFKSNRSTGSHKPTKSKAVGEAGVQTRRPLDHSQAAAKTSGKKSSELRIQDEDMNSLGM